MPCRAAAHLLVSRVLRSASRVSRRRPDNAVEHLEHCLCAPEAAAAQNYRLRLVVHRIVLRGTCTYFLSSRVPTMRTDTAAASSICPALMPVRLNPTLRGVYTAASRNATERITHASMTLFENNPIFCIGSLSERETKASMT